MNFPLIIVRRRYLLASLFLLAWPYRVAATALTGEREQKIHKVIWGSAEPVELAEPAQSHGTVQTPAYNAPGEPQGYPTAPGVVAAHPVGVVRTCLTCGAVEHDGAVAFCSQCGTVF